MKKLLLIILFISILSCIEQKSCGEIVQKYIEGGKYFKEIEINFQDNIISQRAQILDLLVELSESFGLSYLFISHDLSLVKSIFSYWNQQISLVKSIFSYWNQQISFEKSIFSLLELSLLNNRALLLRHGSPISPLNNRALLWRGEGELPSLYHPSRDGKLEGPRCTIQTQKTF